MIKKLAIDEILLILKNNPEQLIFDWKRDLNWGKEDVTKSEKVKDIVAIANTVTEESGYIFYGVDPNQPDSIIGISRSYDDSRFQQLLRDKVSPRVEFIYYEVLKIDKRVGVIEVFGSSSKPHIIMKDYGKLREGQILIRRGSSTGGIQFDDLLEIFLGSNSPYLRAALQNMGITAKLLEQVNILIQQQNHDEKDIDYDINKIFGF